MSSKTNSAVPDFWVGNMVPGKLTSSAFSTERPPVDWCDSSLLIPHEALRHELQAMLKSIEKLSSAEPTDSWRTVNFCRWFVEVLVPVIHSHHDNEELIFFPAIKARAQMPDRVSDDHKTLVKALTEMQQACSGILAAGGVGPVTAKHVESLKSLAPPFAKHMLEHLQEEEEITPPLLRAHFTMAEHAAMVQQIVKRGGLGEARLFLPSILAAMREWATPQAVAAFLAEIPPPVRHLVTKYYVPDYANVLTQMRDSPLLPAPPRLKHVPCCGCLICCKCCC